MKMEIRVFIYLFSLTLLCKENRWLLKDDIIIYLYLFICNINSDTKVIKMFLLIFILIDEFSFNKSY